MKTSKDMQKLVEEICYKHNFHLDEVGEVLKLKLAGGDKDGSDAYIPLEIERLTETTVRVAHMREDEATGEVIADPEVIFYTSFEEWVPMEIHQPVTNITSIGRMGGNRQYVFLTDNGKYIKRYLVAGQADLAVVVKSWFNFLKHADWLTFASNARMKQTSFDRELFEAMRPQPGEGIESITISSGDKVVTLRGR